METRNGVPREARSTAQAALIFRLKPEATHALRAQGVASAFSRLLKKSPNHTQSYYTARDLPGGAPHDAWS
jgi:hypothetical protein